MRHLRFFVVTAVILTIVSLGSAMTPAGAFGPGDNFNQPFGIAGGSSGRQFFDNTNFSTKQPCEPNHAGNSGGRSTGSSSGSRPPFRGADKHRGGSFDTLLAVYRGNSLCGGLRRGGQDDCQGIGSSCVAFIAQPYTTYRIAVDGYNGAPGLPPVHPPERLSTRSFEPEARVDR